MKHTAVVAIHHLPCLHQDSQRLATNQYEICGLKAEVPVFLGKNEISWNEVVPFKFVLDWRTTLISWTQSQ
jgi:hypothetical protein